MTLYELLTLEPVFTGERRDEVIAQILHKDPVPPRRLNKLIPVDLETICLKSIERDPDRRYQTARQLALDLRRYVERHAISARRLGPIGILAKKARRHPGAAAFCALLLAVVIALPLAIRQMSLVQQRQDLLDTQQEVAAALLRGDFGTAERRRQDAIDLGATDSWRRFTRGHIELLQGDYQQATEHLEFALELEPKSIATKSLLAICKLFGGDEDAYRRHMNKLDKAKPSEFEDLLFLGYASTWSDPYRSLELLREAEQQNSNHPMVRLWHAIAYRWCAMDCADSRKALEYVKQGLENLVVARQMHEESSIAAAERVLLNFVARNAYLDLAEEDTANRNDHLTSAVAHERDAMSAAELLESFPDGLDVQFGLAIQVQQTDDKELLRKLVSKLEKSENVNPYVACYVGMQHLALGEFVPAAHWIDEATGRKGELTRFLKYLVLLSDPAEEANRLVLREEFKRYVNAKIEADEYGYLEFDWVLLVLIGESELAAETIEYCTKSPGTLFASDSLYQHLMQGGPDSEGELLTESRSSRRHMSNAHFFLGVQALSQGDRNDAERHFVNCLAQDHFHLYNHWLSHAFLRQMDRDKTWPDWNSPDK